jgi:hypothetical protein
MGVFCDRLKLQQLLTTGLAKTKADIEKELSFLRVSLSLAIIHFIQCNSALTRYMVKLNYHLDATYRKVASSRLSWLVKHQSVFRMFMRGEI